jgi:hypothetical protein
MKKTIFLLPLLILACNSVIPTPIPTFNDFPPPPPTFLTGIAKLQTATPPMTAIVEFPRGTVTPADELHPSMNIQSNTLSDARTFLLILKMQVASGDTYGFAENVRYPIRIKLDGKMKTISTKDEFVANANSILNDKVISALNNADENQLTIMPEGILVANGTLRITPFCMDTACSDTEFLITQINN